MKKSIDINCDMGESFGRYTIGNDEALMPMISSCNIACGWHAGDAATIERTIRMAIANQVRIGAHPSYPDREGFGRRYMQMSRSDLSSAVKYQIGVIKSLAESMGGRMTYVKPHGALYNRIAANEEEATIVYTAIKEFDEDLMVMGLAGSSCVAVADSIGIDFIPEAFADRAYDDNGHLLARTSPGAVITEPFKAASQAREICQGTITSISGNRLPINARSICLHGDNPEAVDILRAIRKALEDDDIIIGHD